MWIQKIKQGETRYFGHLYEKHAPRLYSLCYRFTGHRQEAEDQLQEVFMRLLKKIGSFRGQAAFSTWAYRLAVNHLSNHVRRQRKESGLDEELPVEASGAAVGDPHLSSALRRAVAALPPGFRKVVILHDQEGFSHEEIGDILGCSPSTSRSQLCRARVALRDLVAPLLQPGPDSGRPNAIAAVKPAAEGKT